MMDERTMKKLQTIVKNLEVMAEELEDIVYILKQVEQPGPELPPKRMKDGTMCEHPEEKLEKFPAMGTPRVICKRCGGIYERRKAMEAEIDE